MHLYFNFGVKLIPGYGLMIILGLVFSNLIALKVLKKASLNINSFIILEAYSLLGGGIGAKMLYLIISYRQIDWSKLGDLYYFNNLLRGGFVFFGGLIGALVFLVLAGHLHNINYKAYLQKITFLIPFAHAFGRIGCFMAGCCYGIPYNGVGHVVFPSNSLAPSGIPLFPVQLLEASCLFIVSFIIWYLSTHFKFNSIIIYLLGYSILRFFIEFLRYDEKRGSLGIFSTSQWISLLLLLSTLIYILYKRFFLHKHP